MKLEVDLLSDTVTLPPPGMREAIAQAELGDDVYGEDPTVNRLQALAAERLGKEAAILVSSGTMANLLALLTHCPRGRKILVGDQSDLWLWEAGGAAVLAGLVYHPVPTEANGELALEELAAAIVEPEDPQCAEPGVVCLENTHCLAGGRVLSPDYVDRVRAFAAQNGIPLHLDGARIFNAAVALETDVRRLAQPADSVSFCLSKGLSAPIGSILAGDEKFISRARRWRKMLGGGMRQAGIIAAAGIFALENMVDRLAEDHANARLLYEGLAPVPGIVVGPDPPDTNIVFWRLADPARSAAAFISDLAEHGVRVGELGRGRVRAVAHFGITSDGIARTVDAVRRVMGFQDPSS